MWNPKRIRLALIATLLAFGLFAFLVLAKPVQSAGENELHSIFDQFLGKHSAVVNFDLGIALANTLIAIFPVAFLFLMVDLYGLRKAPVQNLGFFAFCLIAVVLNVIVSIVIWFSFGGWGPPAVGPIIAVILVAMLIPAIISEWRIFASPTESDQIAG
ncbi:MAG TPA: hypothetical protein PKD64_06320 [Pirellulaceae bacterium]|nr:hypothetical protein [Pirellulaceae bacterium]HMO91796.1 hypothetical protein [Pirellulaceae bacterium]HMP69595.1 hypothetical protein [Pirellulaceae bacterium]